MNNQSEDNASNAKPEAEVVCSQNSSLDNDEAAEADQRTRFISNNHQTTSSSGDSLQRLKSDLAKMLRWSRAVRKVSWILPKPPKSVDNDQSGDVNTPIAKLKRQKTTMSNSSESLEQVAEEARHAIWPDYDHEKFVGYLDDYPGLMESRTGPMEETLLHRACRYGNKKAVVTLLDRGASPCVATSRGVTPLHLSCQFRHFDITKMLVEKGAHVEERDDNGDQPIHSAAKSGCMKSINLLVENNAYICSPGQHKNTVIHYAAKFGRLALIDHLLKKGCPPSLENILKETPLHLAAGFYSKENKDNVAVIERLLDGGAKLDARTAWGDTAMHYAGRYGTAKVMEFLLDEGTPVSKPTGDFSHRPLFEKYGIDEETAIEYEYTLLQKVAKSTCIIKCTIILDKIMKARNILARNMYYSTRGTGDEDVIEMNQQQMEFLHMSAEFYENSNNGCCSTLQMFLKYCPDSLKHLFDLCVVKPCAAQVQGTTYFDFFLFTPRTGSCGSELAIIDNLINYGKERFLTHPIFEVFLKLKWYRTWKWYLLYVFLYLAYLIALCGFSLAHLGTVYQGAPRYEYQEHSIWWHFLAVCHVYIIIMALSQIAQEIKVLVKTIRTSKGDAREGVGTLGLLRRGAEVTVTVIRTAATPTLAGVILYMPVDETTVRYCTASCIILTCTYFMGIISRLPGIGLYVHMLSKVMVTVLNFFATYFWSFLGYAIAFHILLPSNGPFSNFGDAFIKVLTMLMGEYDYTLTFVTEESSSWMARIIFVAFVVDMSVVLMNLVLGLAISDIEELQKNSEVRRMIQETYTVMFIDGVLILLANIPGLRRLLKIQITGDRTCSFKDVYYLDLLDLDPNSSNRLGVEMYPDEPIYYPCPHHIVTNIAKIIKAKITNVASQEPPENLILQGTIATLLKEISEIKAFMEGQNQKKIEANEPVEAADKTDGQN